MYSFQGQYTLPLAYQGVSKYSWQTVGNVFAMITGIIAVRHRSATFPGTLLTPYTQAGLYGNIGIKVAYRS